MGLGKLTKRLGQGISSLAKNLEVNPKAGLLYFLTRIPDPILTKIAIPLGHYEKNPLVKPLINEFGTDTGLMIHNSIYMPIIFLGVNYLNKTEDKLGDDMLRAGVAVNIWVSTFNLLTLYNIL